MASRLLGLIKQQTWLRDASAVWLYRITSGGCQFLNAALLIRIVGVAGYGEYLVIMASGAVLACLDFGLGSAAQNRIAVADSSERQQQVIKSYVKLAIRYGVIAILIAGVFGPYFLSWFSSALNDGAENRLPLILACALFVLFSISSGYVKILVGKNRSGRAFILQSFGAIFISGFLFVATIAKFTLTPLWLVVIVVGAQTLWAVSCWLVSMKGRKATSRVSDADEAQILRQGLHFSAFAIQTTVLTAIIYVVLHNFVSAQALVVYFFCERIASTLMIVALSPLIPLSPQMSVILMERDIVRFNQILKKFLYFSIPVISFGFLIFFVGRDLIIEELSHREILYVSAITIGLFFVNSVMSIWIGFFSTALQAGNQVKLLTMATPAMTALTLGGLALLGPKYGVDGAIGAIIIANLMFGILLLPRLTYRHLNFGQRI